MQESLDQLGETVVLRSSLACQTTSPSPHSYSMSWSTPDQTYASHSIQDFSASVLGGL